MAKKASSDTHLMFQFYLPYDPLFRLQSVPISLIWPISKRTGLDQILLARNSFCKFSLQLRVERRPDPDTSFDRFPKPEPRCLTRLKAKSSEIKVYWYSTVYFMTTVPYSVWAKILVLREFQICCAINCLVANRYIPSTKAGNSEDFCLLT